MKSRLLLLAIFVPLMVLQLNGISIGSKSIPSVQAFADFPAADLNNTMLGFAAFENGFGLEDATTSCTFDSFFPISGVINMSGGTLQLKKDLVFGNQLNFLSGGTICGNCFEINLPNSKTEICIPSGGDCLIAVNDLDSVTMDDYLYTVDWANGDQYIVAGTDSEPGPGTEVRVFYFDGSTLTTTAEFNIERDMFSARWHPTLLYTGFGKGELGTNRIVVHYLNTSNGTYDEVGRDNIGAHDVTSIEWHTSGLYMIAGTELDAKELIVYDFDAAHPTNVISESSSVDISGPHRNVRRNTLSFSPGGNFMTVGTDRPSASDNLLIYSFNGSLSFSVGVDTGYTVEAADYSITGTYVAAGLNGSNERLRIYKHDVGAGTLTEVLSARVGETKTVLSTHWSPNGKMLAVGLDNGDNNSVMKIYKWNEDELKLSLIAQTAPSDTIRSVRWSRGGSHIARGDGTIPGHVGDAIVSSINVLPALCFKDTVINLNSPVAVCGDWKIKGDTTIIGCCGAKLRLDAGSNIIIADGARLTLEDIIILDVGGNNIRNETDNAALTLRNAKMVLSHDYTFSKGSILYDCDVWITGTNKFIYTSKNTSTIGAKSTLLMDRGLTFSYAPLIGSKNLLHMVDDRSTWFLDCATVHTTHTGFRLATGSLLLDNAVTFSSEGRNTGEAIEFDRSLNVKVLGGATVDLFGQIKYS